ncbi:hypothetical protein E2K98_25260 [Bacillus salipaludis]|uniref:C39 family peptidase n=1 Tax=Bacillus salipaludis TaxID=2547811 RepID=A0A4R5VJK8_9BACI|nr:C39 family peptidase [Bacillus salipaludis]MDQ6597782.1 C39 family peptidase [Bacillus salipaludis]TDK57365.1 hypothetical protein E2K98_25260 [Bacillus salipaludis]
MKKILASSFIASAIFTSGVLADTNVLGSKVFGASAVEAATTTTYKTTVNLNLRKGPGTKYSRVLVMPKGKTVTYISKSGNWYKVKYKSYIGYASSKYLKKVSTQAVKTVKLNVPYVSQLTPTYAPFGCEGASLLMALKYKGYTSQSLKTLLDKMPRTKNNPYLGYAGTPYKNVNGVFQSIFPKPLTNFGRKYSSKVVNGTGYTTTQLKQELDNGNPAVVYVTLNFAKPTWAKWDMGSAGKVNMVDNMHVVTLIGYNKSTGSYYVADPNSKSTNNKYWVSKSVFERSYNALKFAVVVR